jgi:hypothetical protein
MHWRSTIVLVIVAATMALAILVLERPARVARRMEAETPQVLKTFAPRTITTIEIRSHSNSVIVRKTRGAWEVSTPTWRPAHDPLVEGLLRRVADLRGKSLLTSAELEERPGAAADFGLDPPALSLVFAGTSGHAELYLGLRSLDGRSLFYRVKGVPGIFATEPDFFADLPTVPNHWRDKSLLTVDPLNSRAFDRLRVVGSGSAFTLVRSGTNGTWDLSEPRHARADADRVASLLRQLGTLDVLDFLSPTSAPPAEVAELRPPRCSLTLFRGSNEVFGLSFGATLTNSGAVLAQRSGDDQLLAVPPEAFELLRISYKQMLDSRILRFDTRQVREVVLRGREDFSLIREKGGWRLLPDELMADSELVKRMLDRLASLDILDIAKEVVTALDLPSYGLAPPTAQILLLASPGKTNNALAVLEIGGWGNGRIFARVPGEEPVYALNPAQVEDLPHASWQLRERTLWNFAPEQISLIGVRHQGSQWTVRRSGTNDWVVPAGWRHALNPFALDEALFQFSRARALRWVEAGSARATTFGTADGREVTLEFHKDATGHAGALRITFGKSTLAGNRYAAMEFSDGQSLTFEFSGPVFEALWREIGLTEATPTATAGP